MPRRPRVHYEVIGKGRSNLVRQLSEPIGAGRLAEQYGLPAVRYRPSLRSLASPAIRQESRKRHIHRQPYIRPWRSLLASPRYSVAKLLLWRAKLFVHSPFRSRPISKLPAPSRPSARRRAKGESQMSAYTQIPGKGIAFVVLVLGASLSGQPTQWPGRQRALVRVGGSRKETSLVRGQRSGGGQNMDGAMWPPRHNYYRG